MGVIAAVTVASVGLLYSIYSTEQAKGAAKKERIAQQSLLREQAEAESRYRTEMAVAQGEAEVLQAQGQKAELERQATFEAERAKKEEEETTALGARIKKTQQAMAAKAGLTIGEGTASDITKETDVLTQKDVDVVKSTSKEKQTALQQMGTLGLQTATESRELLKKGAEGAGDLLKLRAQGESGMAYLRERAQRAELTSKQVGSLFQLSTTALGAYNKRQQDKQQTTNWYKQSTLGYGYGYTY